MWFKKLKVPGFFFGAQGCNSTERAQRDTAILPAIQLVLNTCLDFRAGRKGLEIRKGNTEDKLHPGDQLETVQSLPAGEARITFFSSLGCLQGAGPH